MEQKKRVTGGEGNQEQDVGEKSKDPKDHGAICLLQERKRI